MQNSKYIFLVLATALFVLCDTSLAQQTASPEKQALIREFLEVSGGKKSIDEIIEVMISFQEKEAPKMLASLIENDKNLTTEDRLHIKRSMDESAARVAKFSREFFTKRVNLGEMLDEVSYPLYDRNFTENELRDLIVFYKTPLGQKIISSGPKMMMEAMMAFSEKLTPKVQAFTDEISAKELARLKEELKARNYKRDVPNE